MCLQVLLSLTTILECFVFDYCITFLHTPLLVLKVKIKILNTVVDRGSADPFLPKLYQGNQNKDAVV